jgi:hypothetical protein
MDPLRQLIASKKGVMVIVTAFLVVIAPLAAKFGIEVSEEDKALLVGLVSAYLVGQGIADHGKGKPAPAEPKRELPLPAPPDSGTI